MRTRFTRIILVIILAFCVAVPLVSEVSGGAFSDTVTETEEGSKTDFETLPPTETEAPTTEAVTMPEVNGEMTVAVFLTDKNRVEEMTLEEYVTCVLAAEMPYTFNTEALKAQAVAARTYCIYKMYGGSSHSDGADVCSDHSHCAAFVTEQTLRSKYGDKTTESILVKIKNAVEQTRGQILTYGGEPILAVFHSRSYRATESSEAVWGRALPYLVSVPTPEEDSITTVTLTDEQLRELFSASPITAGTSALEGLTSSMTPGGRQGTVTYYGKTVNAKLFRTVFGFRSTSFEYSRTADGWIFTVHGYGHGVGMSQYGANEMAKNGSSYEEILSHYYVGTTLSYVSAESDSSSISEST